MSLVQCSGQLSIKRLLNALVNDDLIDVGDDPFKFSVSNFANQVAAVGIKQVFDSWNQHLIPGKPQYAILNFVSSQVNWVIRQ